MISSPANPAIKRIRALRSRKERDETGLFFAEGIRIVAEAAELVADINTLIVAPELLTSRFALELAERLRGQGVEMLEVTPRVFQTLSGKEGPQGIGAVIRQHTHRLADIGPATGLCWIALESVADPGNLGTILRTSDAVGGSGVILVGPSTDPFDPTALRAGMGALFTQQVVRTDLTSLLSWKAKNRVWLVGTSDAAPLDYRAAEYPHPLVLFLGSEREGLSEEALAGCDLVVSIPMAGHSDSLNLAVATGVMLYEIYTRRHPIA